MNVCRLTVLLSILFLTPAAYGQISADYWSLNDGRTIDPSSERSVTPNKYQAADLNISSVRSFISQLSTDRNQSWQIDIPLPDGSFETFEVTRNQVMPAALIEKYPGIGTFTGTSLVTIGRKIYLDVTPHGLHAMTRGAGTAIYVDPFLKGNDQVYVSYYRSDYSRSAAIPWSCDFGDPTSELKTDPTKSADPELKIVRNQKVALVTKEYRLAITVTGEYTAIFGGTVAGGLAAVVTTVNRVTGVYESETGVMLSLIPNNDLLIYTNPLTDPFTNSSGDLNRVQNTIDMVIGSANYDVGHIFTSSNGGVASLAVVCNNGSKARGLTGLPNPTGDPFYIDYVAHEMGHQFGGHHTFNGDSGACSGGNRTGSAAYEPGSGATIQAYAGICGNDNLQSNSDAYFHLKSLMQITDHINGSAAVCANNIANGNNMPISNANAFLINGKTIPASTPFELEGEGTDIDGDNLTFQWDEWDLGPQQDVNAGDNGTSPIFRSFFAKTTKKRVFPRLTDLLNNTTVVGETLPTTDRTLNFQFVVRDNVGGWMTDMITLNVENDAGPFLVTSLNTAGTWSGTTEITWDVAGTDANGINCGLVDITLSTDGGLTYPIVLADDIANNGSANVVLPNIFASAARIKVKCSDNVFFDINDATFMIEPDGLPCNTTEVVSSVPIPDGTYSSAMVLTGSGTVPASGLVSFTGTTAVDLVEEFTIIQSGQFSAHILPCTE